MRCVYLDLDGTLLGPHGVLLRDFEDNFSSIGIRALEACYRADVEVCIYSGRKGSSVFEAARLIGSSAYIFELGCGLVLEGETEWLADGLVPSADKGTIFEQIGASGAPALLLERFAGRLEYHTPWAAEREVSHLFRGNIELAEATELLSEAGLGWLRMVDNGVAHEHSVPGVKVTHVYHLIPAGASKSRAVARHMQARGYAPEEVIAVGDSREDMDTASVVGAFWLVANALVQDPTLAATVAGVPGVPGVPGVGGIRLAAESNGAGVYEAIVTTLAEGR